MDVPKGAVVCIIGPSGSGKSTLLRCINGQVPIDRGGATFLLACRLVPIVPFSLTGYVAGAARVPIWRFTWTTAVGYLPITAYFVYLGSKLEGFSIEDPIVWIGAGGMLLALL